MLVAQSPPPIVCLDCTPKEQKVLKFLQTRGISDKNALATVLGNIKQESNFEHNVCEGGAIIPYDQCLTGGYGLIQWTSQSRYDGLAHFARAYAGDPNTFDTQLRYMVNENQWQRYALYLKANGNSVDWYMSHAYDWLGWGIHGNRTEYAYQYTKKLTYDTEPVPSKVSPRKSTQSQTGIRIPFGFCSAFA